MILVLDFGSQYNQLITRRIREFGVYSELHPHTLTADEIRGMNVSGIIFSGGPNSVYDSDAPRFDENIFELGIPIVGICYGMQLIAHHLAGRVEPADKRAYGQAEIDVIATHALFQNLPKTQIVGLR